MVLLIRPTCCSSLFTIALYSFSWTSGFLASMKQLLVNVVAVVSYPATKNNVD